MRCTNCGLPLSPSRTMTACPRCGTPVNAFQGAAAQQQQFDQASWEGSMGGVGQQSPWGQGNALPPNAYSPFPQPNQGGLDANRANGMGGGLQQTPLSPRRPPYAAQQKKNTNSRMLFIVAGLFVFLAAMILGLVYVLGSANSGNSPQNTANTGQNTPVSQVTTTPAGVTPTTDASTPDANASPTGTVYPGQQYIDGAQMAAGVDKTTLKPQNPTTTFTVGSSMYVVFNLHPPGTGGAVCSYWYLGGTQVTSYPFAVKGTSRISYTYAKYGSAGQGYVELYWASDKTCSDKVLAQHVDFTVTAA